MFIRIIFLGTGRATFNRNLMCSEQKKHTDSRTAVQAKQGSNTCARSPPTDTAQSYESALVTKSRLPLKDQTVPKLPVQVRHLKYTELIAEDRKAAV